MQLSHRLLLTGLPLAGLAAVPAAAQTFDLTLAIPRKSVAEYHAPYVAIWLEKAGAAPRTLAIWYDYDNRENGGKKWLTDLRSWWRASGRSLTLPADGISGATRPPGTHKVSLKPGQLAPGQYTLVIEAARELGGREVVRLPIAWTGKPVRAAVAGTDELGAVALTVR
ncbi:MAG: DUF2271 domain-containing protein [Pseudomonadota bacterium]